MATTVEILSHRITLALGVIALTGLGLGYMDTRHASASDLQGLQASIDAIAKSIKFERLENVEDAISGLERRGGYLLSIPDEDRGSRHQQELLEIERRREKLLRKLSRMMGSS